MSKRTALAILVVVSVLAVVVTATLVVLVAVRELDWYWPVVVGVVASGWVLQTWREVRRARRPR